jgi:hypothetical protein
LIGKVFQHPGFMLSDEAQTTLPIDQNRDRSPHEFRYPKPKESIDIIKKFFLTDAFPNKVNLKQYLNGYRNKRDQIFFAEFNAGVCQRFCVKEKQWPEREHKRIRNPENLSEKIREIGIDNQCP